MTANLHPHCPRDSVVASRIAVLAVVWRPWSIRMASPGHGIAKTGPMPDLEPHVGVAAERAHAVAAPRRCRTRQAGFREGLLADPRPMRPCARAKSAGLPEAGFFISSRPFHCGAPPFWG